MQLLFHSALTLRSINGKSNVKVLMLRPNLYADWRLRQNPWGALREKNDEPPEQLLQAIWFHQRLLRQQLRTTDGRKLVVLHPGFWNHSAGPDFQKAIIQVEGEKPCHGSIEVDLHSRFWSAHGHKDNPAFNDVILHVVWEAASPEPRLTLSLREFLDSPLPELALWLGTEQGRSFPPELQGQCSAPLSQMTVGQVSDLVSKAALVRLQSKASEIFARARQTGWDQTLWERVFRALGYQHNIWPMQRLAELCGPQDQARSRPLHVQARLLGLSGLLPPDLERKTAGTDAYLRKLWDHWWRERETYSESILPRNSWRLAGLRPANNPQRRLALAAHWLAWGDFPKRVSRWAEQTIPAEALLPSLWKTLQIPKDEFWSWHWTLRSPRQPEPQPLIGEARVSDLALNVILPWLWARAAAGKNEKLQAAIEERYFKWPASEDNHVLKLARQRLFGGSKRLRHLNTGAMQQGLLQIVKDFCEHSDALCTNCQFPKLVHEWRLLQSSAPQQPLQRNTVSP